MNSSGIELHFHCSQCLAEGARTDIEVGVSRQGDLVIWCGRHDHQVARFSNDTIGDALLSIVGEGCTNPDCHREEKGN